jgi:hypothetical protein
MNESLIIPIRKSDSEGLILSAVAVASPGTIRVDGTLIRLKGPNTTRIRSRNPAILA